MTGGLLLQLYLLVVCAVMLYLARHQAAFSPLRMFLYGWIVVLVTTVSGIVLYRREFDLTTFALVLATLVAFTIGTRLAPKYPAEDHPFGQTRDSIDWLTQLLLCALAAVGALIILRELRGEGSALLENFTDVAGVRRNENWERFNAGEAESNPIRSAGVAASLAVATLLPVAIKQRRRLLLAASVGSALVVTGDALLAVGRFNFGVLVICLLISSSLVYGGAAVRRVFTLRRLAVAIPIAVYFLVIFPAQRSPFLAESALRSLRRSGDADFPDWVVNMSSQDGMAWVGVFARSTAYFSSALDKLNYFTNETNIFSWDKLGLYNLPQISQVMGITSDETTPWHQIRLDIAYVMSNEGWSLNPWSTGIRDLAIDFGPLTLPVIVVLGYIAQTVYNKCVAGRSYIGLITASYVSVSCLIFAFISPSQIRIVSNGFWLLAAVALAHFMLAGRKQPVSASAA